MLLDLPVPFRLSGGVLWVESQAMNGLRLWAENFSRLTVCAPVLPDDYSDDSTHDWVDPSALVAQWKIRLVPLPWGYRRFDYFKFAKEVRSILGPLIDCHTYLCFSNVGGLGAWSNLGVDMAIQRQRPYSVWFDNVAHEMPRDAANSLTKRVKAWLDLHYGKSRTLHAVRHAGLGLFHGKTVYDAYAPRCLNGVLVHDVHCGPEDAVSDDELNAKLARQSTDKVLHLGYAGRVHAIKGPFDWIESLTELSRRVSSDLFDATWFGGGPALEEARQRVEAAGLSHRVRFAGHVRDREALLRELRRLDVFVFCHLTPESPRCLIESLISGTPLMGYDSAYARDLLGDHGGGEFVPIGDKTGLAIKLQGLVKDRSALRQLTHSAARARETFNDEAVFKHRSDLIKQYLRVKCPVSVNSFGGWCEANRIAEVIVVSPHLDDGVLSAHTALSGKMCPRRLLATVFSDASPEGQSDWARHTGFATNGAEFSARRLEDQAATAAVGARFLHLNEHADRWCESAARSVADRLEAAPQAAADETLVLLPAGAGQALNSAQRWIRRLRRLPLGPPQHGEHLAVRDGLLAPLKAKGFLIGFYAEIPYVWSDKAMDLKQRAASAYGKPMKQLEVEPDLQAKYAAIRAYQSQLVPILGSKPAYQLKVLAHREIYFLPL